MLRKMHLTIGYVHLLIPKWHLLFKQGVIAVAIMGELVAQMVANS